MVRIAGVIASLLIIATTHDRLAPVPAAASLQITAFTCPMHPDVRSSMPGTCSICGMTLVRAKADASLAYDVELETEPVTVAPGRPFRLQLTVREPRTGAIVENFVEVHERRFHLFVISQDLEHYAHLHPEQQEDGSWAVDMTVPRSGYYKVYSDFLPRGGRAQVIAGSLETGDATAAKDSAPRLVPDTSLQTTVDTISVSLDLARGLVAGREETFVYTIRDGKTGVPVTDLQPYLGAWGHSLISSEDTMHVVHAHPVELIHGTGEEAGGPTLTFKASLPEPGLYRIWTQFKRDGTISTAVFTVAVGGR